jgi:hypothetical protein
MLKQKSICDPKRISTELLLQLDLICFWKIPNILSRPWMALHNKNLSFSCYYYLSSIWKEYDDENCFNKVLPLGNSTKVISCFHSLLSSQVKNVNKEAHNDNVVKNSYANDLISKNHDKHAGIQSGLTRRLSWWWKMRTFYSLDSIFIINTYSFTAMLFHINIQFLRHSFHRHHPIQLIYGIDERLQFRFWWFT